MASPIDQDTQPLVVAQADGATGVSPTDAPKAAPEQPAAAAEQAPTDASEGEATAQTEAALVQEAIDDFDPDNFFPAAGPTAPATTTAAGGTAAFDTYDPGALDGGRDALALLGADDITGQSVTGLYGSAEGARLADITPTPTPVPPTPEPGPVPPVPPGPGPIPPGPGPGPIPPDSNAYQARAVLFATKDADGTMTIPVMKDGALVSGIANATITTAEGSEAGASWFSWAWDAANSQFTLTLTDEGRAALAAKGSDLYHYVTVTIDGYSYKMQVVVNADGNYASTVADQAADSPLVPDAKGLWGQVLSETEGTGKGTRETADGDDIVTFSNPNYNAVTFSGTLNTHGGNDTLTINGTANGAKIDLGEGDNVAQILGEKDHIAMVSTNLKAGDGDNEITVKSLNNQTTMSSTLTLGDGNNTVNFSAESTTASVTTLASNTVLTAGDGDNTVSISAKGSEDPNTIATAMAFSQVNLGDGNNTVDITASAATYAQAMQYSSLTAGDGDNVINVKNEGSAGSTTIVSSQITAGDGDNTITLTNDAKGKAGYNVLNRSTLTTGDGDNTISIIGGGSSVVDSTLKTGNGDNTISVHSSLGNTGAALSNSTVQTGSGDDAVSLVGSVTNNSVITLGDGVNALTVGGYVQSSGITSGTGDDTVSISGYVAGSTINTGSGDNTITVGGSVQSASKILAGDGNDRVTIGGALSDSSINVGAGDNVVKIVGEARGATVTTGSGNDTISALRGYSAKIYAGDGNNEITFQNEVQSSEIYTGSGNDTVNVGRELYATVIDTGAGDDQITVKTTVGDSSIRAGDGNNRIELGLTVTNSRITAGSGNDTLTIASNVYDRTAINLGDGDNTLTIGGNLTDLKVNNTFGGASTITTGAGNDDVTIKGSISGSTINLGEGNNTLKGGQVTGSALATGHGNDTVTLGSLSATNTADSRLVDTGGSNTVTITGGVTGRNNTPSSALIALDGGTAQDNNTLSVGGGISSATIRTGASNDTVTVKGYQTGALTSVVELGSGHNALTLEATAAGTAADAFYSTSTRSVGMQGGSITAGGTVSAPGVITGPSAAGDSFDIRIKGGDIGVWGYSGREVTITLDGAGKVGADGKLYNSLVIEGGSWGIYSSTKTSASAEPNYTYQSKTAVQIMTGDGNDHVTISGNRTDTNSYGMLGGTLNVGHGDNIVSVSGGRWGMFGADFIAGNGNNKLTVTGGMIANADGGLTASNIYGGALFAGSNVTIGNGDHDILFMGSREGASDNSGGTAQTVRVDIGDGNSSIAFIGGYHASYGTDGSLILDSWNGGGYGLRGQTADGNLSLHVGSGDNDILLAGGLIGSQNATITIDGGNNHITLLGGIDHIVRHEDGSVTATDSTPGSGYAMYGGSLTTGEGYDSIYIAGGNTGAVNATINTGGGNDTITVHGGTSAALTNMTLLAGSGDDHVTVEGAIKGGRIDLGSGHDVLEIDSKVTSSAVIDGGEGIDTLNLGHFGDGTAFSIRDLLDNTSSFNGFEEIDLGHDGKSQNLKLTGQDLQSLHANGNLFDQLFDDIQGDEAVRQLLENAGAHNQLLRIDGQTDGDGKDHVSLDGTGWSGNLGSVTVGNDHYSVYSHTANGQDDPTYILIREGLV